MGDDVRDAVGDAMRWGGDSRSDRHVIGKPHPDRARQFKPFAALKGYHDMLEERERDLSKRSS